MPKTTPKTLRKFAVFLLLLLLPLTACSDDDGVTEEQQCTGPYTQMCNDQCVSTQTDPDHCGACNTTCGEDEACQTGQCVDTCSAGLEMCDSQCVSLDSNPDHCGECGNDCDAGEGCSLGECVDSMTFERDDAHCLGGGPAIVIEDPTRGDRCSGQLRQELFDNAICSCDRAVFEGLLTTDGFDSASAPYEPGLMDGPVAMNDHLDIEDSASIDGNVTTAGRLDVESDLTIMEHLYVGENLRVSDDATIAGDASIASGISASTLTVGGTLTVPEGTDVEDYDFEQLVEEDVTVEPPCPCDDIPDVPAIIEARQDHNDNEIVGLDADLLVEEYDAIQHLALPCGHYFFHGSDVETDFTIVAQGRTAIYIDDDFSAEGQLRILPAPGAELDLFIDGQITAEESLILGSPNFPASTRVYVDDQTAFEGDVQLNGFLFGEDHMTFEGDFEIFGGLFAGNLFSAEGDTSIHYDHQVRAATDPELTQDTCPDPDAED